MKPTKTTVDIKKVRKYTALATGDSDLSHLTKEVILEARKAAKPIKKAAGHTEGNTFQYNGGKWYWRDKCNNNWLVWGGNARATRIVNCANGFIHYSIDWW